jgi:hypothetical protein
MVGLSVKILSVDARDADMNDPGGSEALSVETLGIVVESGDSGKAVAAVFVYELWLRKLWCSMYH